MRALGLFGGVTRFDVLIGVAGAALIEWSSFVVLAGSHAPDPAASVAGSGLAIPIRVVPSHGSSSPKGGRLKLGGGGAGKSPGTALERPSRRAGEPQKARGAVRGPSPTKPSTGVSLGAEPASGPARASSSEDESPRVETINDAAEREPGGGVDFASGGGDGDGDGTGFGEGPPGEGFPEGSPEGTITDPLVAHALRLYRQRITAWLSQRFRVSGSGLSKAELLGLRVRATLHLDEGRRVVGFQMTESGNRTFDDAARQALDSVRGLELPPPPSHYPGPVQRGVHVTFVCREDACN